ncbi:MAG: glycosyltransferase [Candidatus Pacebacteria bacterium]|nr:glycosyltransferase [Candidatus Paceibacterota bacterium]
MNVKTLFQKILKRLRGGRVILRPSVVSRGRVLLSYKTDPFFDFDKKEAYHSNMWECREIANIFLRLGYTVDVIDWFDYQFVPHERYDYFIDLGLQMRRIGGRLNADCVKVFHTTTSHWRFNNAAERERLAALAARRGAELKPRRLLAESFGVEDADFCTLIGNGATESTYAFANKKMHRIPVSTARTHPFPDKRDIERAKKNFIWLGGVGAVHKGLDLVLEAFALMPEYHLTVCGDVATETDFADEYRRELYETENITYRGRVDIGGDAFSALANTAIAAINPSCAEGQSVTAIDCMHAGLIPVLTAETGVDTGDFGVRIDEPTVDGIVRVVRTIAAMENDELVRRSREAWKYARKNNTRERFSEEFTKFVTMLEKDT